MASPPFPQAPAPSTPSPPQLTPPCNLPSDMSSPSWTDLLTSVVQTVAGSITADNLTKLRGRLRSKLSAALDTRKKKTTPLGGTSMVTSPTDAGGVASPQSPAGARIYTGEDEGCRPYPAPSSIMENPMLNDLSLTADPPAVRNDVIAAPRPGSGVICSLQLKDLDRGESDVAAFPPFNKPTTTRALGQCLLNMPPQKPLGLELSQTQPTSAHHGISRCFTMFMFLSSIEQLEDQFQKRNECCERCI